MSKINWTELKAAGYRVERIQGTLGWRGPCWLAYGVGGLTFGPGQYRSKGLAMRACRDHADGPVK